MSLMIRKKKINIDKNFLLAATALLLAMESFENLPDQLVEMESYDKHLPLVEAMKNSWCCAQDLQSFFPPISFNVI